MSKSKKKTKGAGLPKRIAGVKVPKAVRKGAFAELLASRQGQHLIAEAILGAGALAAGMKAKGDPAVRRTAQGVTDDALRTGDDIAAAAGGASATLAYAVTEAARAFAQALREGRPSEPRSFNADAEAEAWTPDYGAPEAEDGGGPLEKQPSAPDAQPH